MGYAPMMSELGVAIFKGRAGSLRLCVEGYEFPEIVNDEWDSNWLMVSGEAVIDGKHWRFRDACLRTFEMRRLATWLDQIATGREEETFCGFIEPNLHFEKVSDRLMRIDLAFESAPPWAGPDDDCDAHGFELPIDGALATAAGELRYILSKYPLRAREPRS